MPRTLRWRVAPRCQSVDNHIRYGNRGSSQALHYSECVDPRPRPLTVYQVRQADAQRRQLSGDFTRSFIVPANVRTNPPA